MTNQLAVYENFDNIQRAAIALFKSGYFDDVKSEAQAIVKAMAGAEVGIAPFASMAGINIIQGKPAFGSNLIATLVENDPRYSYKLKRCDDEACIIEWYKNGEKQGESSFTMEEARKIKQWNAKKNAFEPLASKFNWQNWPSDMLFARALTRGQKRFAAGIAGGAPLYTPEELGADEDENGNVIDGNYSIPENIEQPDAKPDHEGKWIDEALERGTPKAIRDNGHKDEVEIDPNARPWKPEVLKAALEHNASNKPNYNASDKQRNLLGSLLSEYYQDDTKRYEASEWLFGAASTKDMSGAMVKVALDWLKAKPNPDDGGAYQIDATAKTELSQVLPVALEAAGQEALL